MKRSTFGIEFYRAFHFNGFFAALLFVIALAVYQAIVHALLIYNYPGVGYTGNTVWTQSLFNDVMVSMANFLLRFMAPFLVCLPHGMSYWTDRIKGYGKNLLTRVDRKSYLLGKWIAAVVSGILVFVLPYILNFLITGLFLPIRNADLMNLNHGIHPSHSMVRLFYKNTFLYAAFYLFLFALFAAACVSICLAVSTMTEFWFTSLLSPFFVCILLLNLGNITGHHEIAPFYFLETSQPAGFQPEAVIFGLLGTIMASFLIYYLRGLRNDVF